MRRRVTEQGFVDLSRILENRKQIKNRINAVGIEVEGGWDRDKLPGGQEPGHDGSVFRAARARGALPFMTGEYPSPIYEVDKWQKWLKQFYPQHMDESCGLHMHMSFKRIYHYQRVMDKSFMISMVEFLKRWGERMNIPKSHCFWGRLAGENRYCRLEFLADHQVRMTGHGPQIDQVQPGMQQHRYTFINYPLLQHSTVECRGLPMMPTVELAESALQEVIDITNAYLVASADREEKEKIEVAIPDNGYREELVDVIRLEP